MEGENASFLWAVNMNDTSSIFLRRCTYDLKEILSHSKIANGSSANVIGNWEEDGTFGFNLRNVQIKDTTNAYVCELYFEAGKKIFSKNSTLVLDCKLIRVLIINIQKKERINHVSNYFKLKNWPSDQEFFFSSSSLIWSHIFPEHA